MDGLCDACGQVGTRYGDGPDPCFGGDLVVISVCCGHGRGPNHVTLRDRGGFVFDAEIISVRTWSDQTRTPFDEWKSRPPDHVFVNGGFVRNTEGAH